MTLERLQIANVRNLERVELDLTDRGNLLVGANGSGKTSVLEAVHLLSMGRSFRPGRASGLIRYGASECTVFGVARVDGFQYSIGFTRGRDGAREFRVNGESQRLASEVARLLPIQVLGPRTVDLIQEGPDLRRRFLNWGVFHVKPAFRAEWAAAERSLRSRNRLLREIDGARIADSAEFTSWEWQLAQHSARLDAMRRDYLRGFQPVLDRILVDLQFPTTISIEYHPGWTVEVDEAGTMVPGGVGRAVDAAAAPEGETGLSDTPDYRDPDTRGRTVPLDGRLAEALTRLFADCRGADLQRGYTTMGYHRAELRVRADGHPAADYLSRGQMKVLAWAMMVAQGQLLHEVAGRSSIYLADEMGAELDESNIRGICHLLTQANVQCIATGLDDGLARSWPEGSIRTSHIEGGIISPSR